MSAQDPSQQGWHDLEALDDATLTEARLQLHWAAQVVAAIGYTHIPPADDDSQSNMGWVDGMQLLAGRYMEFDPPIFASLSPRGLRLGLHDAGGDAVRPIEVEGRTLDEIHEAMEKEIHAMAGGIERTLNRPEYDLPDHPVAHGERFGGADAQALEMLGRWFHDANLVLRDLRAKTPSTTMPRVWPHHFDMGSLIDLDATEDADPRRQIGLGLSPGDASDPQPYWYVAPYPRPEQGSPPEVEGGGRWTTEGFTGYKLAAADLLAGGEGQEERARAFVASAVAACREMLAP